MLSSGNTVQSCQLCISANSPTSVVMRSQQPAAHSWNNASHTVKTTQDNVIHLIIFTLVYYCWCHCSDCSDTCLCLPFPFPWNLFGVCLPLYVLYCMWYIGYHNSSCCDMWLPDNTFMYSHEYTVAVCRGTVPLRLDSCCFLALRYVHNGPHWIKDQWHIESFLDDCKNSEGILLFTFSWSNSACMTLTCMTLTRAKPFACLTNLYVYMYDNIDPTYICFLINISYVSSQFVP